MNNDSNPRLKSKKKHSPILLLITTIYGIVYLISLVGFYLEEFKEYNLEWIITSLAFVLFLVGYLIAWKYEMIAGIIFVFWWGIMWILGLFIAEHDKGAGVVMGLPLFVLGILYIVRQHRKNAD